jgi:hypothetical protein
MILSWLLQARAAHAGPVPGCRKPKLLMLIHSWLLQLQTSHVDHSFAAASSRSWWLQTQTAQVDPSLLP